MSRRMIYTSCINQQLLNFKYTVVYVGQSGFSFIEYSYKIHTVLLLISINPLTLQLK